MQAAHKKLTSKQNLTVFADTIFWILSSNKIKGHVRNMVKHTASIYHFFSTAKIQFVQTWLLTLQCATVKHVWTQIRSQWNTMYIVLDY